MIRERALPLSLSGNCTHFLFWMCFGWLSWELICCGPEGGGVLIPSELIRIVSREVCEVTQLEIRDRFLETKEILLDT